MTRSVDHVKDDPVRMIGEMVFLILRRPDISRGLVTVHHQSKGTKHTTCRCNRDRAQGCSATPSRWPPI